MPRLMIVIGSTRPGRAGLPVATWFAQRARAHGGFDVEVVDLADLALPFLDEPHHPRLRRYVRQHTKDWSARVDAADAIVLVTPEYNHSFPAVLKNALDYLHEEWQHKPVGFVSYGGVAAGLRAVQHLKEVVTTLRMVPMVEAVSIPFHTEHLAADGAFEPSDVLTQAAGAMLDALLRTEAALRPLREPAAEAA